MTSGYKKNAARTKTLFRIYRKLYARFGPQGWWPADGAFEVMVGAILTQNTAWSNVEKAIANLKGENAMRPARMAGMPHRKLAALIKPSGFFNVKAARLRNFLRFYMKRFDGDIRALKRVPLDGLRKELLSVNGIGKETADSILLYAAGKPSFVVDAYTKRVFSRHGFVPEEAGYDALRDVFMKNLPARTGLFKEYHALLVALCKRHCLSRKPVCRGCPLSGIKGHSFRG